MTQTQRPPTLIPSVIAPAIQTGATSSRSLTARLWRGFTTLRGRFTTLLIAILIVTSLTAVAVAVSSSRALSDLNTISQKSIPGTTAAQNIVPYLEDIDAHASDYLANSSATLSIQCINSQTGQQLGQLSIHDCASKIIDSDLLKLNHQLFLASQNVPYSGLQTALEQTQTGLETYVADINLMRHDYSLANPDNPNDPHLLQAYQDSRAAQTILLKQLPGNVAHEPNLPSCTLHGRGVLGPQTWPTSGIETNMLCLSSLGKQQEDSAYQDTVSFFGISLGIVFGLSIYSCIFLVWTSWSMATVTRKFFNLGLIAALLVVLFSTTIVLMDFDAIYGHNGYFSVVDNAYNNVYTAGALQQEGTQAQANQARWLTALNYHDQTSANQWQQDEQSQSQQVVTLLHTLSTNSSDAQDTSLIAQMQQDWKEYTTQVGEITQLVNAPGTASYLGAAENLHTNGVSSTMQIFIHDVQQFSQANTNNYTNILIQAGERLSQLTTLWAIIFPILGVLGAWGVSRRLKDF
ncbi:MAG TPA: hypothetical protein VGM01_06295 [Ktedonobacteraceae bacterium]|jgi:hypothetical protein